MSSTASCSNAAASEISSKLELETVLQRLVDELASLLGLDAADLYLYDRRRRMLRSLAMRSALCAKT